MQTSGQQHRALSRAATYLAKPEPGPRSSAYEEHLVKLTRKLTEAQRLEVLAFAEQLALAQRARRLRRQS